MRSCRFVIHSLVHLFSQDTFTDLPWESLSQQLRGILNIVLASSGRDFKIGFHKQRGAGMLRNDRETFVWGGKYILLLGGNPSFFMSFSNRPVGVPIVARW